MILKKLLSVIFLLLVLFSASAVMVSAEIVMTSLNISEWVSVDAAYTNRVSQATVSVKDGVLHFSNTSGLWPGMRLNFDNKKTFNLESDYVLYDFTPGTQTSIRIYFTDNTGETQFVDINQAVSGAVLDKYSGDIKASAIPLKGEMPLKELKTGIYCDGNYTGKFVSEYANGKGEINITGICVYIIGNVKKTIDIRRFSILTPDETTITTVPSTVLGPSNIFPNEKSGSSTVSQTTLNTVNASSDTSKKAISPQTNTGEPAGYISEEVSTSTDYKTSESSKLNPDTSGNIGSATIKGANRVQQNVMAKGITSSYNQKSDTILSWILFFIGLCILLLTYFVFFKKKPQKDG